MPSPPFWKTKALDEMTREEWESLCDGCAQCCTLKLEDEDSKELVDTGIVCRYLDTRSCRCKEYRHRSQLVPDCMTLSPENLQEASFAPETCAYRRLAEGRDLPDWHPLLTGSRLAMRAAGFGVDPHAVSEEHVHPDELLSYFAALSRKP